MSEFETFNPEEVANDQAGQELEQKPEGIQLLESIHSDKEASDLIYNGAVDMYETTRSYQAFRKVASEFRNTHPDELEEFRNYIVLLEEKYQAERASLKADKPQLDQAAIEIRGEALYHLFYKNMGITENMNRFVNEEIFHRLIGDASDGSRRLIRDIFSKKPDMVYSAPRSTFFPVLIAKACFKELEHKFGFSKYFDTELKVPYFFHAQNKAYRSDTAASMGGFDINKIIDVYPDSTSIPNNSSQILNDLGMTGEEKGLYPQDFPDGYTKKVSRIYELVEEAAESIKTFSKSHPNEKISIAVYDESKNTGNTLISLLRILENARKKIPNIDFEINRLDYTNGSQPPEWFRPMTFKEMSFSNDVRLSINHQSDDPFAFQADRMTFELARLLGKQLAKEIAYRKWHKDHPFKKGSKDQKFTQYIDKSGLYI